MPTYAITMLAAGIGIPVLAAMNAALGRYLGAPMLAGATLLAVGFLTRWWWLWSRGRCYCKASIRTVAFTFSRNFSCVLCIIDHSHCTKVWRW